MSVLNNIKDLYRTKISILNHISLFCILGIYVLCAYCCLCLRFYNIASMFLDSFLFSDWVQWVFFFSAFMVKIFFIGYSAKFVWKMFNMNFELPVISLNAYSVFVILFPLILVWGIYIFLLFVLGVLLFPAGSLWFNVYYLCLAVILPFVNFIFMIFSSKLKYRLKYFDFVLLFEIFARTFVPVVKILVKLLLWAVIPFGALYLGLKCLPSASSLPALHLSVKLICMCVGAYFALIFYYLFCMECVGVIKTRLSDLI